MSHDHLNPLWKATENLKGDKRSGTVAEDQGWLGCSMFDQAPDIIGIGREPVLVVLWPVEQTPGKTATIIGDHLIVCDQVGNQRVKGLACATGPWDQDEERPRTAHVIR
jgi:hypothetical protein